MSPPKNRQLDVRALLESVQTSFTLAHYGPRDLVFAQGDPCDSVMHIEEGLVRLAVTGSGGKEAICGLLGAGAFLGVEALAGRARHRETAISITAAEVLVVAKARMLRLLHAQSAIADRFIAHMLARNARLEADLVDQLLHSSEQRLARALLVLSGCDDRHPCRCILPDVSQEIIAEIIGTTRSRVNGFMGKFKRLGLIKDEGGRIEVNSSLLHLIHDGDQAIPNGTSRPPSAVGDLDERPVWTGR